MVQATTISRNLVKTAEIIGTPVMNTAGENLGEIKEIVLDKLTGKVQYAVLAFGGILGLGDKLFALPWEVLSYDETEDAFILNIDKEILKTAPGFDKNRWPDLADAKLIGTITTFYAKYKTTRKM